MMQRLRGVTMPQRTFRLVVADVTSWMIATAMFGLIRYDLPSMPVGAAVGVGMALATVYVGLGALMQLHQGRASVGSLDELLIVGPTAAAAGMLLFVVNLGPHWVGRSVPLGITMCFMLVACAWRAAWRALTEPSAARDRAGLDGERVMVIGAGDAGRDLIGSMLRDPARAMRPVGLLDDDPYKRHLRIRGVPVLGPIDALPAAVRSTDASRVIIRDAQRRSVPRRRHQQPRVDRGGRRQGRALDQPVAHRPRRHPGPARHRPHRRARPQPARHRHRSDRRLSDRQEGPGHRRRRVDRVRALPPDQSVPPRRADHAGSRRVGTARGAAVADRPRAAGHRRRGAVRHP